MKGGRGFGRFDPARSADPFVFGEVLKQIYIHIYTPVEDLGLNWRQPLLTLV